MCDIFTGVLHIQVQYTAEVGHAFVINSRLSLMKWVQIVMSVDDINVYVTTGQFNGHVLEREVNAVHMHRVSLNFISSTIGLRSFESSRLPPLWHGFKSLRRLHLSVCVGIPVLVLVHAPSSFPRILRFSPLLKKTTRPTINSTLNVRPGKGYSPM